MKPKKPPRPGCMVCKATGVALVDEHCKRCRRKQVGRDRDQRVIESGRMTAHEVSRANAIATSVVHPLGYKPSGKVGLPR